MRSTAEQSVAAERRLAEVVKPIAARSQVELDRLKAEAKACDDPNFI